MWQEVRDLFPIHRQCAYLNNAGVTPPSLRVLEALEAYHRLHADQGWPRAGRVVREAGTGIKRILAELLRCPPTSLALVHNTSEGMNIVAQGLRWSPGDTVLGFDREYPANVYPWWNLERKGVRLVRLEPTDPGDELRHLERELHGRVRVVAVSAVDWRTGAVRDLAALGGACKRQGVLLIVDVAQALGVVPLDPRATGMAALAGSAWKWLLGPVGLGILYVSEELLGELDLVYAGTDSVADTGNYLPYRFTLKPDASRFEFSTPNHNDWVYFQASLKLLEEIGFARVRERILSLTAFLRDGLTQKGFRIAGPKEAVERSGIVSFRREGRFDALGTVVRLAEQKIVVKERDGMVRVSPHVYNNEEELERLLAAL